MKLALGRLCGCGVMNPRRVRTCQMVETDGVVVVRRSRWNAIVWAPLSLATTGVGRGPARSPSSDTALMLG